MTDEKQAISPAEELRLMPGINAEAFARTMTSLMADVIADRVSPQTANAACNAASQLLKLLELHYKYKRGGTKP